MWNFGLYNSPAGLHACKFSWLQPDWVGLKVCEEDVCEFTVGVQSLNYMSAVSSLLFLIIRQIQHHLFYQRYGTFLAAHDLSASFWDLLLEWDKFKWLEMNKNIDSILMAIYKLTNQGLFKRKTKSVFMPKANSLSWMKTCCDVKTNQTKNKSDIFQNNSLECIMNVQTWEWMVSR